MIDSSITLYAGSEPVLSAYVGTTLVYPSTPPPVPPTPVGPYDEMYFTTRVLEDRVRLIAHIDSGVTSATSLSVSTDSGQTWRTVSVDGTDKRISLVLDSGQTAIWKGIADSWGVSWNNHLCFYTENNKSFEVEGNIMSLLYGDNFIGQTQLNANTVFTCLFYSGHYYGLVNAENLILPATTLTESCYSQMFASCHRLIKAPALPATNLHYGCYSEMFGGCSSLTTAPDLPATTLVRRCYQNMFNGCTSLNSVKCLATDISASDCTTDWVSNVSSTGTFTKASGVSWSTGINGIPSNWTVVEV